MGPETEPGDTNKVAGSQLSSQLPTQRLDGEPLSGSSQLSPGCWPRSYL